MRHGSSSSSEGAWEMSSVLTLDSSLLAIGPSFFWSWKRTLASISASGNVTVASLGQGPSRRLRGGSAEAVVTGGGVGAGGGGATEAVAPAVAAAGAGGSSQAAAERARE